MSAGGPYLESGESIVLTTDRVSVENITYDAMLTTRRLILIDSRYSRFEPRTLSLSTIHSVRSGKAATGEPVILLSLEGDVGEQHEQRVIVFLQEPAENRKMDRDLWVRKFIELSVSGRDSGEVADRIPAQTGNGIRPSVRRWVAPEIIRPHSDIITIKEPVPEFRIIEDEPEKGGPAVQSPALAVPDAGEKADIPAPDTGITPDSLERVPIRKVPPPSGQPADKPERDTGDETPISRSILAATRSLITAKAREDLAHPPAPARIRTTSVLPDLPPPVTAPEAIPEIPRPEEIPAPDSFGGPAKIADTVQVSSPPEEIPSQPEPVQDQEEQVPVIADSPQEPAPECGIVTDTKKPDPAPEPAVEPSPPRQPAVPPAPEQTRPGPANNPLFIPGCIIILLLVAVSGFMIFQASLPPAIQPVPVIPTITPTPVPSVTPMPTTVPAYQEGVWVRFSSAGRYTGMAGNPGITQTVSGYGEQNIRVVNPNSTVMASAEKTDNNGEELTITIFKNGRSIASRSTSAPMGSLELLIDPVTEQPPGIITPAPTAEMTRVGGRHLEYY